MTEAMVSIDEAARIALDLPEVTEGERHGHRTWFVAGKAFAWERPLREAIVDAWLACAPDQARRGAPRPKRD
jgi:hypothetical protein